MRYAEGCAWIAWFSVDCAGEMPMKLWFHHFIVAEASVEFPSQRFSALNS
jgi:hypothetical protein